MSHRKSFLRAPRKLPTVARGEEELRAPEARLSAPTVTLASRMSDVLFTGGASLVGALAMAWMHPGHGSSMLLGGATMFTFGLVRGGLGYRREQQQYRTSLELRHQQHEQYLAARRAYLNEARQQQQEGALRVHPPVLECMTRAENADLRLFERRFADPDFLSLRVGTGACKLALQIKAPTLEAGESDPLLRKTVELASEFSEFEGPICAPVLASAPLGLVGGRPQTLELVRCLMLQLATHHSPVDVKMALFHNPDEDWRWARWLPHLWDDEVQRRFMACDASNAQRLAEELLEIGKRRSLQEKDEAATRPIWVILFASDSLTRGDALRDWVAEEGHRFGLVGCYFGSTPQALPKECRAVIDIGSSPARLSTLGGELAETHFLPDALPLAQADRAARALMGLKVEGGDSAAGLSSQTTLLELFQIDRLEEVDLLAHWRQQAPFRSMAVPIGLLPGGKPLELNLHESGHGPHGLVAGTTGSGKTAFLSSFLASLAFQFHPHEVAFVCIDYKGGDLFRGLEELPHLVGTLTNLEKSEVWRCLRALQAENERRMRLFSQVSQSTGLAVNKIDEYQELHRQGKAPEPLPKLLIVCDEFAELSKQEPEFIARLVSIARVGRSLGVHLILATQQPAGIIGDQIESNTRFRIAFKFNKIEDSKAVLKRPEAASIRVPGRAYFQLGENEVFELFQAGYGGNSYRPTARSEPTPEICEILGDGQRRRLTPQPEEAAARGKSRTEMQELAQYIAASALKHGIRRLPGPWLAALPATLSLDQVQPPGVGWNGRHWTPSPSFLKPAIGLLDDPGSSYQGPLQVDFPQGGHLAVYARPAVGTTNLLMSLVLALVRTHSPAEVQFYLMDFSGSALSRLGGLPHVGEVVTPEDPDRCQRLLRFLQRQLATRKQIFARAGVSSLTAYRETDEEPLPAIFLILDNYSRFSKEYGESEDVLATLVQEGGSLGLYVVLSAPTPSSVKPKTGGSITQVLALQLADRSEYALAVGRTEGLEPAAQVGRGLVRGKPPLEFQTALALAGDSESARTEELLQLCQAMDSAWRGPRPARVPVVPKSVTLTDLDPRPASPDDGPFTAAPVGLDIDDVSPLALAPADGPHFFVSGSMQSGKSNFLVTWALSLAARMAPDRLRLTLIDFREGLLQPLARLPHVADFVDSDEALGPVLERFRQLAEQRKQLMKQARLEAGGVLDESQWTRSQPTHLLLIDDFETLRNATSALNQEELIQLVKSSRIPGIHVILAGSVDDMGCNTYDGLFKAIAAFRTGILLGTRDDNGVFNGVRVPQGEVERGCGFFVQRGSLRSRFRAARPGAEARDLLTWLDRLSGGG